MKKAILWRFSPDDFEGEDQFYIVDSDDVIEKVSLHNSTVYKFPKISTEGELFDVMPNILKFDDEYELQEVLNEAGIEWDIANESEPVEPDMVCLDFSNNGLFSLSDAISEKVYGYWDGHNWKERWIDEYIECEIVYNDSFEVADNIDKWDGYNWYFERKFNHGKIYPVIEIDGEKVEGQYVLLEYTQYQGDIEVCRLIDEDERKFYVDEEQS